MICTFDKSPYCILSINVWCDVIPAALCIINVLAYVTGKRVFSHKSSKCDWNSANRKHSLNLSRWHENARLECKFGALLPCRDERWGEMLRWIPSLWQQDKECKAFQNNITHRILFWCTKYLCRGCSSIKIYFLFLEILFGWDNNSNNKLNKISKALAIR